MRLNIAYSIIIVFLTTLSFGQNSKIDSLVSKELNLKWVEELQKIESKEEQINFIKEKIKSDSIVSYEDTKEVIFILDKDYTSYDTVSIKDLPDRISKCKVLFILQFKKYGLVLNLNRFPNQTLGVSSFNIDNIDEIVFVDKKEGTEIYGTSGFCRVIILKSSDKKLKRIIRKSRKN